MKFKYFFILKVVVVSLIIEVGIISLILASTWVTTFVSDAPEIIHGKVIRVLDGDTVEVRTDDWDYITIRYIGMDTPEIYSEVECYGPQASRYNKSLVEDKYVTIKVGEEDKDIYGRTLGYVYLRGSSVQINGQLIRQGYATVDTVGDNTKFKDFYERMQLLAVAQNLGLWRHCHSTH